MDWTSHNTPSVKVTVTILQLEQTVRQAIVVLGKCDVRLVALLVTNDCCMEMKFEELSDCPIVFIHVSL